MNALDDHGGGDEFTAILDIPDFHGHFANEKGGVHRLAVEIDIPGSGDAVVGDGLFAVFGAEHKLFGLRVHALNLAFDFIEVGIGQDRNCCALFSNRSAVGSEGRGSRDSFFLGIKGNRQTNEGDPAQGGRGKDWSHGEMLG